MEQSISVIATLDDVEPVVFGGTYGDEWSLGLGDLELRFPVDPEERARIAAAMIECLQQVQAEALKRAAERVRLTACGTVACEPGRHRPDCGWARIDIGEDYRPAYASPLPQAELDESESERRAAFGVAS